jgi:hypothetical protein
LTLQLLPSEFPYIWGKFIFLFYQCSKQKITSQTFRISGKFVILCPFVTIGSTIYIYFCFNVFFISFLIILAILRAWPMQKMRQQFWQKSAKTWNCGRVCN